MRTRFLPTDYSTTAAGVGPLGTLDFIGLPLPLLPPRNYPSVSANFQQSFDEIPVCDISYEVDKLTIDDALSIFLSDVLPHFVDGAGFEEPRIGSSREKTEVVPAERCTKIFYGNTELDRLGSDSMEIEEKDGTTSNNKGGNELKFVQFEIPDMNISLLQSKNAPHSNIECSHIFSDIPEAEFTMEPLNSELMLHDLHEIERTVYSVVDMSVEYSIEQKANLLEDADSVQGEFRSHNIGFPLFELNAESSCVLEETYTVDELLSFENAEKQQVVQPYEAINDNKDLLGSVEFDMIKYLLHHSVATQYLEDTNFSLKLDYVSIVELSHRQDCSTLYNGKPDGDSIWLMDPILFDEFLFIDLDQYLLCEVVSDLSKEIEAETCESMFGKAMNFRSLSELIVCHELTLMDDSFKSLPIPLFSDHGNTSSLHTSVEELLAQLDCQSSSASDCLYLDWHLLGEDECESAKYSSCWKMLWEIDAYDIDAAMISSDSGKLIFDFILSEGHSNKPNAEDYKKILNLSCSDDVSLFHSSGKADISTSRNHGDQKRRNEEILLKTGVDKVPIFGESMSSDLEFFLNPRNYVTGRGSIPADKSVHTNTACQVFMHISDSAAAKPAQHNWSVKMHQVQLSDNILVLIDYLWRDFLALLENDKELIQMRNRFQASNDLTLLHLPNDKLICRLQEKVASSIYLGHNEDNIMVLALLIAIKQMAFYLCYYGIQATYLYIDKLSTSLQCVKARLSFVYNLIRDENQKAKKELSILHPSISVLQEVLQTTLSNHNSKILIVSDQVFWYPLKRLLTSLKMSYNEPQHLFSSPSQRQPCCEITDAITDIMLNSDCCLVSHEYVTASFPFSKFSFILEYGGANVSSRISSVCPKPDGLSTLCFLKVQVEESSIAEALCHGVSMPKSIKFEMASVYFCEFSLISSSCTKRDLDSALAQKENKSKLEELLNTIPVKEVHGNEPVEAVNEDADCSMLSLHSMPVGLASKQNLSSKPLFPDTIVIVNTRNFNEEMVISRRSTYQRILEMEKEGAQVVERDICLPVDLIVSSAVSLTWYDFRNIGRKASAPDEGFSCLPLCVESIAASTLTSLSFAFSCCILIFEGECNFLCSIMESSDELYAAAASLGIDIQLFCSYSSEMTEEILLSCISVSAKLSRGLYPKMSDSESLAESFLTAFASINPLSAHAILSSDAILGKFLELSNGGKISALQKYQVPDVSIALLSAISRYGEREDSKSGMTDCSSSVSIADSGNVQFKGASKMNQPKHTNKLSAGELPNNLFHVGSQKLLPDDQHNLSGLYVSCNSWLSGGAEISDKLEHFSLSCDEKLLSHIHDTDADIKLSSDKSSPYDFPSAKGLHIPDQREKPWMPPFDIDSSTRWRSVMTPKNNLGRQSIKGTGILQENFTGEVIDVEDTQAFGENFSVENSSSFSKFLLDVQKDYAGQSSKTSKQPHSATNLPIFRNPADIDSASGAWISRNDRRQILREETKPHYDTINRHNNSMMSQKGLVGGMSENAPQDSYKLSFQENSTGCIGGTPLSNALHSSQLQQGSPWTIEFLNRIRERSRLRKQSVSHDLASPRFGSSSNTSKLTKRKSPSILEFYKYKGGNTLQKTVAQKKLKGSSRPLNSMTDKIAPASCPSSWTPPDKRARRRLSFSTSGSGGQRKLVWRETNYHTAHRRL
ncbi:protein SHORTAGE IN CHIASMATA 1 [Sesamum indicum]|uniref:Protein SHORTAGE IN CHIASMATA 1 n=1 Tax=Sesamum indicum TaxID=4182 RepID=A0A8M8UZ19_SESIN|nr:protein SHORTAGE IN CHIASMATA 1 [Sesamum indicum]